MLLSLNQNQNVKVEEKKQRNNYLFIIFKKTLIQCLLFFVFLFFNPLLAQDFTFSEAHKKAYHQIFSLQNPIATKTLQDISISNGISTYLDNLNTTLPILLNGSPEEYENWLDDYDDRIDNIEGLNDNSPYYRFIQAEMRLQAACLKFYFGDKIRGFFQFRQAYKLLEENIEKYPQFLPTKKTLGVLNILLGSVPNEYTWIMNGLGFHGNIQTGLTYLNEVKNSSSLFNFEADLFLVLVNMYILKNEKSILPNIEMLYQTHPKNLLVEFIYASYFHQIGQNEKSLISLKNRSTDSKYTEFPFLYIMLGNSYLQKGLYTQAAPYYHTFLEKNKGINNIKQAYYRLFIVHQLSGNTQKAKDCLKQCVENGETILDTDRFANRFAKENKIPDNTLIKARLMTDGGYYIEALNSLKDSSYYTQRTDLLEFHYRKARIYHKLEQLDTAITEYKTLILLSKTDDYSYFAPNSCLQLAYIYQQKQQNILAKHYFEKALKYDDHEYKNSIDNKAKAGLNQLSE